MRYILPPDIFGLLGPALLVGVSVFIALFFISDDHAILRVAVIGSSGALSTPAFAAIWLNTRLRLRLFRLYYRYWGPRCRIRILGDIPVDPGTDDKALLGRFFDVARDSIPGAETKAELDNRLLISDGFRTLTLDVVRVDPDDNYPVDYLDLDGFDEFEQYDDGSAAQECRIAFDLAGYQGNLTKMDAVLEDEVAPLLEDINDKIKRQGAHPTLSVRAVIDGRNPFFVFHLRDMPNTDANQFRLCIATGRGAGYVAVDAAPGYVNVAARSPTRLLTATRRLLASPLLGGQEGEA